MRRASSSSLARGSAGSTFSPPRIDSRCCAGRRAPTSRGGRQGRPSLHLASFLADAPSVELLPREGDRRGGDLLSTSHGPIADVLSVELLASRSPRFDGTKS